MTEIFHELRAREFSRLDAAGHVYLDYTGSGLYPESLVRAHAELLRASVLGNPHSHSPSSSASTRRVDEARARVRDFFGADSAEYEVVFTLNASGALKLVGESYPFGPGSRFVLTADNHNSVNGIREFAKAKGASVVYVPLGPDLRVPELERYLEGAEQGAPNLFAYPAQSNFSGVRHPLEWIEMARARGYDVLLDAAAFVPTNRLDLSAVRPDFVCVSFYKMFGFPTGVGALLARREALGRLRRPWFAGGTVRYVSAQNQVHLLQSTGEAFEDGTLNFLSIAAVPAGLDFLAGIGMERIHEHVTALTALVLQEFTALHHSSGAPLVRIHGPTTLEGRGATVAFSILDPDGKAVDLELVERRAAEANISLRTGCFCNPGAAEAAFQYEDVEAYRCFRSLSPEEFTLQQFSSCMNGKPVGAVRVSLGIAANEEDVRRLVEFLESFRDARFPAPLLRNVPAFVGA